MFKVMVTAVLVLTTQQISSQQFSPEIVQHHEQKCGLPNNIGTFPDYAQAELTDLWSTWITGTSCSKELTIQQDIINLVNRFSNKLAQKKTTKINNFRRSIVPAATTPEDYEDDYVEQNRSPFPKLIGTDVDASRAARSKTIRLDEVSIDDIATLRFNVSHAPFLRTVSPEVRRQFETVWNDENIPSESLRILKIQMLAVSLLNARELEEYNRWATRRRYVLKARERELSRLSPDAKRILKRMSNRYGDYEELPVPPSVKQELRDFVIAFNRRRSRVFD